MDEFRVALSADFRDDAGRVCYPDFDLAPLDEERGLSWDYVGIGEEVQGPVIEEFDALVLLAPRFTEASVPAGGRLSLVARFGVGYDTVNQQVCTQNGIILTNTPDAVRRPVAVSILTLMLALTGKLFVKDRITRQAEAAWATRSDHMGFGLVGKTLGSLGFGNIAGEMFRLSSRFDMRFIAHDPYADTELNADLNVERVDLERLFRESDILCVNCDLNETTRNLVDVRLLSLMKPTSFLINTARGPIVNQQALTEALQQGRLAGAGLDVLQKEPPDPDDPLLSLDNVILAPHALAWTDQLFAAIGRSVLSSVLEIKGGRVPQNVVNRDVLDNPLFWKKLKQYRQRFASTS